MNNHCNNRNPLQRSGVNQYQRVLQALLPTHASVDERDQADLILFARNYARQLTYFDINNTAAGDWQEFMSMDVSVTLAALSKTDVAGAFAYVKNILDTIKATDMTAEALLQQRFKVLFDVGFALTSYLNEYYTALPHDFEFKTVVGNIIRSSLPDYYTRMKKYYTEAINAGILDASSTFTIEPSPFDIALSQDFGEAILDAIWLDSAAPVFTPTFNGSTVGLKIKNTATHNLFTGIFDQYLKTLTRIASAAGKQLDHTLNNFPAHSPHYGLYLTFLKLFKYAQAHINTFSGRHLDLYYKEILRLYKKEAAPDQVHLTFELAKGKENHLLRQGTLFKGGKDIDNEEIFYALTNDIVVNRGSVKSLKSLFVQKNLSDNTRQVFASPVANSADGLGAKLENADKSWKVFGDSKRTPGSIGFVVASHYLYLKEGNRNITFHFHTPVGSPVSFAVEDIQSRFTLQLTGEKGWIDVPIFPANVTVHTSRTYFSMAVSLDGGQPAVVAYSPKLHGHNFNTTLPLAKFNLQHARATEAVWDFTVAKVGIGLNVTGIKEMAIQNEEGPLASSKPFNLFGASPHPGSAFILGNKEIFMKTLQPTGPVQVKLTIAWDNPSQLRNKTDFEAKHTVDIYHLENALWKETHSKRKLFLNNQPDFIIGAFDPVFSAASLSVSAASASASLTSSLQPQVMAASTPILEAAIGSTVAQAIIDRPIFLNFIYSSTTLNINLPPIQIEADYTPNENYTVKSKWGFLKIELNSDFGHSTYAQRLADAARKAVITSTQDGTTTTTKIKMDEVDEPFTPRVNEISLDYACQTDIDFASGEEGTFFHLTPFGSKDISTEEERPLLPEVAYEGELYIGIENFTPNQTLSVLFKVAEGSADPLQVKQEVTWFFLSDNNQWKAFKKEDISDATNDLTQSGIIRFAIPEEATAANTLLTEPLHWIRATVAEKTQAVCKLIEVMAQAAKAELIDYKNTGNYFKATLPASTISKMVVSDSAIKKTNQPFASFGGRVKEQDTQFYVRVSERLRHKNRSVAMWDYERMVLEAFPAVYKAKCINHTQILEQALGTQPIFVDNERKPGHVLLVPIPHLQNKNAFDPLRPYSSAGLLTEIRKYLYHYISPHVNLNVRNPRFEEIQLEFKVKYRTADNEFYTRQLKTDLEQFMAPGPGT